MSIPSGAAVSISTGLPFDSPSGADRAARKFHDALQESYNMAAELQSGSPLAREVFKQYQERLVILASQDPVCLALEKVIRSWRHNLEVAPINAEKEALRVMGPQMGPLMQEEMAAPE